MSKFVFLVGKYTIHVLVCGESRFCGELVRLGLIFLDREVCIFCYSRFWPKKTQIMTSIGAVLWASFFAKVCFQEEWDGINHRGVWQQQSTNITCTCPWRHFRRCTFVFFENACLKYGLSHIRKYWFLEASVRLKMVSLLFISRLDLNAYFLTT